MSELSAAVKDLPSLQKTNPHPRDEHIRFVDEGHVYYVRGDTSYTSSTTFIHTFFSTFDADATIARMMKKPDWGTPGHKYYGHDAESLKRKWEEDGKSSSDMGSITHRSIEYKYNEIALIKYKIVLTEKTNDSALHAFKKIFERYG